MSILGRAQAMIQSTIDATVNRALVVLSFLVAAGLGTAAVAHRVAITYGIETALISLAVFFVLVGIAVMALRPADQASVEEEINQRAENAADTPAAAMAGMSDSDRELLLGLLSAAAPMLAPRIAGMLVRNVPVMLAVGVVFFILARQAGQATEVSEAMPSGSEASAAAPAPAE